MEEIENRLMYQYLCIYLIPNNYSQNMHWQGDLPLLTGAGNAGYPFGEQNNYTWATCYTSNTVQNLHMDQSPLRTC